MTPVHLISLLCALAIGVTLGGLGSGGSIVTLPVLVYIAGVAPAVAVSMSLAIVGATSFAGSYLYFRSGHVHVKAAVLLGATGVAGAYLGAVFTDLVQPSTLMLIFAGLMLVVGSIMLQDGKRALTRGHCRPLRCALIGGCVGMLTGFLGVGGGFLIVPALVVFAGLEMKTAVGTSLAIIALNSASGLLAHTRYVRIDWQFTALFIAVSLVGMIIGISLVRRVASATLNRAFALLLILLGLVTGTSQLAG